MGVFEAVLRELGADCREFVVDGRVYEKEVAIVGHRGFYVIRGCMVHS